MKCSAGWKESFKGEPEKNKVFMQQNWSSALFIINIKMLRNYHESSSRSSLVSSLLPFLEERKEGMRVSAISGSSSDYCTLCEGAVLVPARFLNEMWEKHGTQYSAAHLRRSEKL